MESKEDIQENPISYKSEMTLLTAADCGDLALVSQMLKDGAKVNEKFMNPQFNLKCTALHYAVRSGHLEIVRLLLENGANVNALEHEDWTPLYYAANNGHYRIAKLLLEHGADKSIKDNYKGRTALDVAKYRQFHDMVELLGGSKDNYIRKEEAIEKRGKKRVLKGIHKENTNLFLGRFELSKQSVALIEKFRKDSNQDDLVVEAEDTVLGMHVFIRHSHDFKQHQKETEQYLDDSIRFYRSSTISTNEHILIAPTNLWDEE